MQHPGQSLPMAGFLHKHIESNKIFSLSACDVFGTTYDLTLERYLQMAVRMSSWQSGRFASSIDFSALGDAGMNIPVVEAEV